jgi:hypothetical protein
MAAGAAAVLLAVTACTPGAPAGGSATAASNPAPSAAACPYQSSGVVGFAASGRVWDGYAGGFYLRSAAACVPLVFRIGDRSTTVLFSVGRRCG